MYLKVNNYFINLSSINIIKIARNERFSYVKFFTGYRVFSIKVKNEKLEELIKALEKVFDISEYLEED